LLRRLDPFLLSSIDPPPPDLPPLPLHDALPICGRTPGGDPAPAQWGRGPRQSRGRTVPPGQARRRGCRLPRGDPPQAQGERSRRSEEHTSELQSLTNLVCRLLLAKKNHTTLHLT